MIENLQAGEIVLLKVTDVKDFGSFLDGGLERDILLPEKEHTGKLKKGSLCLVALKENLRTKELFATMHLYDFLSSEAPFKKNETTTGTVYKINKDIGVFVAVDNKYHGLILNKELYGEYSVGENIEVRIKNIREDGKLELSVRKPAYSEIEDDSKKILDYLKENKGKLPLNDHSSPEAIKAQFKISKKAFKRATGRLLKEGAIKITEEGIELNW